VVQHAFAADAMRSRRNNLVYGSLLLAFGLGLAAVTYQFGPVCIIGIGPIVVGARAVFRGLVA
jgi:hypothetical protein